MRQHSGQMVGHCQPVPDIVLNIDTAPTNLRHRLYQASCPRDSGQRGRGE